MTAAHLHFHQRLKAAAGLFSSGSVHDWARVASRINLFPVQVPRITIASVGGASYFLTVEAVCKIVGETYELYLRARDGEVAIDESEEAKVADLTKAVFSHRLFSAWVDGEYRELDLLLIIERTFLDRGDSDLATVLIHRLHGQKPSLDDFPTRVLRRNGEVALWNPQKIEVSVRKALVSVGLESGYLEFASKVAGEVTSRVRLSALPYIGIEDVQNVVEQAMTQLWASLHPSDAHLFTAIRSYMTYRSERAALREQGGIDIPVAAGAQAEQAELAATEQLVQLAVVEDDGSTGLWDGEDLRARIRFALTGLSVNMTEAEIERALRTSLFDGIKRSDIHVTINLNAKTLIERDADFARFAGRIQLTYIYEEVLGWDIVKDGVKALKRFHQEKFVAYIERGIGIKRLTPDALRFDMKKLAEALEPQHDLGFDFLGVQTLYDRYLIVDKTGKRARRLETPQFFWMRVAMGLFLRENAPDRFAIDYYRMLSERRFCASTPTLFNSCTLHSQLSSCFLYKVDDSMESIFGRGIYDNAQLSKWAGGLGGSWTAVRGTGAYIAGTNGESQGVIPFLKLHNDQLVAVNQGGKRKGSGCAYLETWHNDIMEFLELRKNTGDDRRRTHDMNTANWVPDLFMKRMESRGTWTLFRSSEVPDLHECFGRQFEERYAHYEKLAEQGKIFGEQVSAIELWKKMLSMLFETGHPWITFKDPCNLRSPQDHVGVIHSSNLCTEITLNTSKDETAVCNLGSVILCNHLHADGSLDHAKLRETIRLAMRGLDNVIDINFYPTEAARTANSRHRPVGMGVMGLAEALYMKGIAFASQNAVEFNDEFMEAIAYYAYEASSDLAAERGAYSSYKGSKWDRGLLPQDTIDLLEQERGMPINVPRGGKMDWEPLRAKIAKQGMRNSNCLAIAPTATISNITGCSPCIEPTYKNLFVKSNLSGDFTILNPWLVRDLKSRGLWTEEIRDAIKFHDGDLDAIPAIPADIKERYLTAFDIDFKWVVDAAARRQKWIDQAQSVNLWLKAPELKTLSHMYRHAWHAGLKTTYYLRTQAASTIEKATVSVKKEVRGAVADGGAEAAPKTYTPAEKTACSIEAMRNGGTCEACQ